MTALRRHECYWTTATKKATRNPEWNEEKEFTFRTCVRGFNMPVPKR